MHKSSGVQIQFVFPSSAAQRATEHRAPSLVVRRRIAAVGRAASAQGETATNQRGETMESPKRDSAQKAGRMNVGA